MLGERVHGVSTLAFRLLSWTKRLNWFRRFGGVRTRDSPHGRSYRSFFECVALNGPILQRVVVCRAHLRLCCAFQDDVFLTATCLSTTGVEVLLGVAPPGACHLSRWLRFFGLPYFLTRDAVSKIALQLGFGRPAPHVAILL